MQTQREIQAIINTLQDPVLLAEPRRGRVIVCNTAFVREMGFPQESLKGKSFLRIPQFTRSIRRGLLDLYFRAKHKKDNQAPFVFQYAGPQGNLKTISATIAILAYGGENCVMISLRLVPPTEVAPFCPIEDIAAFNALVNMIQDPWMEFRSRSVGIPVVLSDEDRFSYLLNLGREFVVHKASYAAQKLFGKKIPGVMKKIPGIRVSGFSLKGKDFISLFYREADALRFLDMLVNVGQLQAPATLVSGTGKIIEAEMVCSVNFDVEDTIAALYCIPRHNEHERSLDIQGSASRQEQDFIFSQPFLGIGHLVPPQPLLRPKPADAETTLSNYLNEILLINANDAMSSLYGVERNALLMQRMARLFPYASAGIQVLRELFVRRQSSFATYNEDTGELLRVALFKAIFSDTDHLTRIFLAVSPHAYGLQERIISSKPRSAPAFI